MLYQKLFPCSCRQAHHHTLKTTKPYSCSLSSRAQSIEKQGVVHTHKHLLLVFLQKQQAYSNALIAAISVRRRFPQLTVMAGEPCTQADGHPTLVRIGPRTHRSFAFRLKLTFAGDCAEMVAPIVDNCKDLARVWVKLAIAFAQQRVFDPPPAPPLESELVVV